MLESTLTRLENLFLALSDKTRLRLLALMAGGEVSVGFLADKLGESQPKISRHLAYLRNTGLVSARRDGKRIYYNIEWPIDGGARSILSVIVNSIASVKIDEKMDFFEEKNKTVERFSETTIDVYAETYESVYIPQEIEIFLL